MSCQTNTCCVPDEFEFRSQTASDADGDSSAAEEGASAGFSNPNCPTGYIWNGTACERES